MQESLKNKIIVWPIAVGGWTEVNEAVYLERNLDIVAAADFFVWSVGRNGQLTRWRSDYVWPRQKPLCATWYVFRRYVLPRIFSLEDNELPQQGAVTAKNIAKIESMLERLSKATGRRVPGVVMLYPSQSQLAMARRGEEWLDAREDIEQSAKRLGLRILDLSKHNEWVESLYRDGSHPSYEGNRVLAKLIATEVRNAGLNFDEQK